MHRNSIRRLVLLDGMIFIAAIAIGIAGGRARVVQQRLPTGWWGGDAFNGAIWVAVAWAVAIMIRLRPPLPRRRLLASQPGFMACVAIVLTFAVIVIQAILTDSIHLIFQGRFTTPFYDIGRVFPVSRRQAVFDRSILHRSNLGHPRSQWTMAAREVMDRMAGASPGTLLDRLCPSGHAHGSNWGRLIAQSLFYSRDFPLGLPTVRNFANGDPVVRVSIRASGGVES